MTLKHELKTWPEAFQAVWEGRKSYELRLDDRGYLVGDALVLLEWDPVTELYSKREIGADITYITKSGDYPGLESGYVVLGLFVKSKRKH